MIIKTIKEFTIFIFGNNAKKRFKRIILTVAIIAFIFVSSFNISCGFDSQGNFYFSWDNIDTSVEIKK